VLEVGFGAGNNLWFLADAGFITHGIEMSATAARAAEDRLSEMSLNADLRIGDLKKLPYENDTFDFILDRGALTQNSYVDIQSALDEFKRVLKPSGVIRAYTLFGMLHPDRQYGEQVVGLNSYDNFSQGYFQSVGFTSFFTEEDLRSLFRGFGVVEIERNLVYEGDTSRVISEHYSLSARCD
jgi:ubiquinone/menaquinone biosynthesis C-methylase UbiE